jgi:hypothetical protein
MARNDLLNWRQEERDGTTDRPTAHTHKQQSTHGGGGAGNASAIDSPAAAANSELGTASSQRAVSLASSWGAKAGDHSWYTDDRSCVTAGSIAAQTDANRGSPDPSRVCKTRVAGRVQGWLA